MLTRLWKILPWYGFAFGAIAAGWLGIALAQQPTQQPPPAEAQACQSMLIELTGGELQWRTQAIEAQRQLASAQQQIADLNRQLAEAKKPPTSPPPPPKS